MTDGGRRVLFLSYYFPPHGGAGVQRSVKFLKHLGEFGYRATVITGPDTTDLAWAPADPALGGEISAETDVLRISRPEPPTSSGWRGRSERILRVPSPYSRWLQRGLVEAGTQAAAAADVIYASMSPWEAGSAAGELARASGRPWVADLRDPWALDEWAIYPTGLHRRLELRHMGRVLGSAAAIVMNTSGAAHAVGHRFPELADDCIHVIPNGYDAADFAGLPPPRDGTSFRIVFSGYAHADLGHRYRRSRGLRYLLGGAVDGLDPLARSHVFLLQAVEEVLARRPELSMYLEVHLAGVGTDVGTAGEGRTKLHGYVPHERAIELMRSADLLFLPLHDLAPGVRCRTVPGKTYEYLASGRPILAAVPEGDTRDLLARAEGVTLCGPKEVAAMAEALESAIEEWRRHGTPLVDRSALLAPFERRALTERLAEVLDAAITARPRT